MSRSAERAVPFSHPQEFFNFKGKVVLVTGSSRGIGAGIARRFGQAGADVVVHFRNDRRKKEAASVARALAALGRKTLTVKAAVGEAGEVRALFDQIKARFGRLDVLVNNAGIYPGTPLLEMSEQEWSQTMDANLKGVFLCTQAAAGLMKEQQEGGSIVNISSIEAVNPAPRHAHYTASKAGVKMFTQTAALELAPHRIRVNAVAPGLINAPRLPQAWPEGVERWRARAPLGRLGEPEDVADACLFLASEAARWITGVHLIVDGGMLTTQAY
ncbi:MAG: SDR family NAD(P)-dependent oxidoreductase [Terriglobia bacterium]